MGRLDVIMPRELERSCERGSISISRRLHHNALVPAVPNREPAAEIARCVHCSRLAVGNPKAVQVAKRAPTSSGQNAVPPRRDCAAERRPKGACLNRLNSADYPAPPFG
jgi:hypothetical protein